MSEYNRNGGKNSSHSRGSSKKNTSFKRKLAKMLNDFERMPRNQQIMVGICAVCVVALIVTGIIMAVVLNTGDKDKNEGNSSSVIVNVGGDYDQATFTIDPAKYPAVLKSTDDAGDAYITETLFVGDSNIERAINYNIIGLSNGIGVTSMGIQSVISKACVYFEGVDAPVAIPQAIAMMQPRRVVLSFGTNNTVGYEKDAFIALYQKVIDAVRNAYSGTDIIINAIPPVGQNRENQLIKTETIDAFNIALAELAQKNSLSFVNTNEALRDASGYAKAEYVIEDGVHLTESGLNAMFSYIRTHSHIVDDARGTVSNVPTHIAAPSDGSGNSIAVPSVGSVGAVSVPSSTSSSSKEVEITYVAGEGGQLQDTDKTKSGKIIRKVTSNKEGAAVTAVANDGYTFVNWSDGSTTATRSDKSSAAKTLTANFKKKDTSVAVTGISLDTGNMTMSIGGLSHVSVSIKPDNATEKGYTVESSNTGAVTVEDAGNHVIRIKGVAAGEATVTVTAKANTSLKTSIKVTVKANEVAVTGLSLNPTSLNLTTGSNAAIAATVVPANATNQTLTWSTNNEAVATVSNGTVVAVSAGTATITATTANGISQTVSVTVTDPAPETRNVSVSSADGAKGSASATATGSVVKGTSVTFTASPAANCKFTSWTITIGGSTVTSTDNPYVYTVDADISVVANFEEQPASSVAP